MWRIIKQNTGLFCGRNTYGMAREELSNNVTFEQRPRAVKERAMWSSGEGHSSKRLERAQAQSWMHR